MNKTYKTAVIVFAKAPVKGEVKTRLAKNTNDTYATDFYKACLQDLFQMLNACSAISPMIYLTPSSTPDYFKQFNIPDIFYQQGVNLGERMKNAFLQQLKIYDKVLLIGSDIPEINNEILKNAEEALNMNDCVIGPSYDGGYYLIGFTASGFIDCFQNIHWSTPQVFEQTIAVLRQIKTFILPFCRDIDTLEDLKILYASGNTPRNLMQFLTQWPTFLKDELSPNI